MGKLRLETNTGLARSEPRPTRGDFEFDEREELEPADDRRMVVARDGPGQLRQQPPLSASHGREGLRDPRAARRALRVEGPDPEAAERSRCRARPGVGG